MLSLFYLCVISFNLWIFFLYIWVVLLMSVFMKVGTWAFIDYTNTSTHSHSYKEFEARNKPSECTKFSRHLDSRKCSMRLIFSIKSRKSWKTISKVWGKMNFRNQQWSLNYLLYVFIKDGVGEVRLWYISFSNFEGR